MKVRRVLAITDKTANMHDDYNRVNILVPTDAGLDEMVSSRLVAPNVSFEGQTCFMDDYNRYGEYKEFGDTPGKKKR